MDKKSFLNELEKHLLAQGVADIEGILEEYEDHFRFKLADGYTEAEVAARLGDPQEVAAQYLPARTSVRRSGGSRAVTAIGLGFLDIFAGALFILFLAWVIALGASAIACAALGASLIIGFNPGGLIPYMPYAGALIMGIACLALALLAALGTLACWRYTRIWSVTYCRWHKRCLAAESGKHLAAAIPGAQLEPRTRRVLRRLTGIAVLVLGVGFILAFVVLAIQAGSPGFWHVWRWFV